MVNAKKELQIYLNTMRLNIIGANVTLADNSVDLRFEDEDSFLDKLDFEYDNNSKEPYIRGIVFCIDNNGDPVWLTRVSYGPLMMWENNSLPAFYLSTSDTDENKIRDRRIAELKYIRAKYGDRTLIKGY
jgi:hypothetical protein